MRINPVLNLNLKNRNYLIQKNSSKPSFKAMDDVFISGLIQKEDKIREHFADVNSKQKAVLDEICNVTYSAEKLYASSKDRNFKLNSEDAKHYTVKCETKRKAFDKFAFIKVFFDKRLVSETEISPKKYVRVKVYDNATGGYDVYKKDYKKGTKEYWQNVRRNTKDDLISITADKIYYYEGMEFKKYEKGYQYSTDKNGYKIRIKERFIPNYEQGFVNYTNNITKDSSSSREKNKGGYILAM